MRINVKNGTIFLGYAATEAGKIRVGEVRCMDVRLFTPADFCPVFADTNEIGLVERLYVEVNPENDELYGDDAIRHINPRDILSGTIIDPKDFFAERMGGKE